MHLMHGVCKELSERGFMTASSYGEEDMRFEAQNNRR